MKIKKPNNTSTSSVTKKKPLFSKPKKKSNTSASSVTNKKIIIKGTDTIMMISVDRNWLAKRSSDLVNRTVENYTKDPKSLNGELLAETLKCHGANEMILEILDKYDI